MSIPHDDASPGTHLRPGYVCAHTHLYSSLARGMPQPSEPPRTFVEILERIWWRLDRALDVACDRVRGAEREIAGELQVERHLGAPVDPDDGDVVELADARDAHRRRLDDLLKRRDNGKTTWLAWLRQSPVKPNSRHMLEHIERLKAWQALDLPSGIERSVHQNRLLKIAREGGQMTPTDLAKFEPQRRYATLVALAIEGMATVTDEIIDLHDRILGKLFNAAKNKHQQQFQASGKAINAKVRLFGRIGQALIEAKRDGIHPFCITIDTEARDYLPHMYGLASWVLIDDAGQLPLKTAEVYRRLTREGEKYVTVSSRGYRPSVIDLKGARYPLFGIVALISFVLIVLPVVVLFYTSLVPYVMTPSAKAFAMMSWRHWLAVLKDLGSNEAIMGRKIFEQEQISRAVELGLGVSRPEEIKFVTGDDEGVGVAGKGWLGQFTTDVGLAPADVLT